MSCDPEALAVLQVVKDQILTSPAAWTKGSYARSANGVPIGRADSPQAASFCLVGACKRASEMVGASFRTLARAQACLDIKISAFRGGFTTISFNDDPATTFQDIQDFLDFVLKQEKKEPNGGTTESPERGA
jgi:hypothetical protein